MHLRAVCSLAGQFYLFVFFLFFPPFVALVLEGGGVNRRLLQACTLAVMGALLLLPTRLPQCANSIAHDGMQQPHVG